MEGFSSSDHYAKSIFRDNDCWQDGSITHRLDFQRSVEIGKLFCFVENGAFKKL